MIKALIKYRLEQAEESLSEAQWLLDGGKSKRSVINRAYYAMFYAVLALNLTIGKSGKKHMGMIALFDQYFVKPGKFAKEFSIYLHKGFELRQMSDYQELFEISQRDVEELLRRAKRFVEKAKEYLEESNLIDS